ncbi:hypothetical protein ACW9YV_16175 (plasmid) [Paraburkholderia strydomiana]
MSTFLAQADIATPKLDRATVDAQTGVNGFGELYVVIILATDMVIGQCIVIQSDRPKRSTTIKPGSLRLNLKILAGTNLERKTSAVVSLNRRRDRTRIASGVTRLPSFGP